MKRKSFSLGRFLYDNTTAFMMLGIFAFFSVFAEGFLSIGNITTVLSSSSVLLLVSIGMCFVVISGGTDLSVAAAYGMGDWSVCMQSGPEFRQRQVSCWHWQQGLCSG